MSLFVGCLRGLVLADDLIGSVASAWFIFRFRTLGTSFSSDGFDLVFSGDELRSKILLFDLGRGEGASLLDVGGSRTCCKSFTSKQRSVWLKTQSVAFDIVSRCFENKNNNCCETKFVKMTFVYYLQITNPYLATLRLGRPGIRVARSWICKFVIIIHALLQYRSLIEAFYCINTLIK